MLIQKKLGMETMSASNSEILDYNKINHYKVKDIQRLTPPNLVNHFEAGLLSTTIAK